MKSTALKGRPHDRATPLLCRGVCVRGSRCAQGNVYGDMCVPPTAREDRDRPSRARGSCGEFAALVPGATLYSAYEAGFSAFVLHRVLTTAGITNIVVHPASIAVAANDKVKTDRRDAKKLAIDLADGRLRGISIPTEAEELARLLPRTRAQIVEHRATLARQIKAKLHQFGLITPSSRRLLSHR